MKIWKVSFGRSDEAPGVYWVEDFKARSAAVACTKALAWAAKHLDQGKLYWIYEIRFVADPK